MQDGYILLHRKLRKHKFWDDKPFTRGQAWIDMLMMANHDGKNIILGNEVVHLERGEFIRTERSLSDSWGWGRTKVRGFLTLCQNLNQIRTKVKPKGNVISVLNYDEYQQTNSKSKPKVNQKRTTSVPRAYQEKECIKECKKEILQYVILLIKDYERLCNEFGKLIIDSKIEDLENYIGINPERRAQKYKDHNKVIRAWLKKDGIKPIVSKTDICPQCKKRPIQVNGLCEQCNKERIG